MKRASTRSAARAITPSAVTLALLAMTYGGMTAAPASADIAWNAGAGNWSESAKWTPNTVPGSSDIAAINNGGVVTLSDSRSVNTIKLGQGAGLAGTLNILPGASLTTSAAISEVGKYNGSVGTINQSGGTVTVNGSLTFAGGGGNNTATGNYNISGGSLNVTGSMFPWEGFFNFTVSGNASVHIHANSSLSSRTTFSVLGSGSSVLYDGTINGGSANGSPTLIFRIDGSGVGAVDSNTLELDNGSKLDLGFTGTAPYAGSWTLWTWHTSYGPGTIALAAGVDPNWSFQIVNNTTDTGKHLVATYIPEPASLALLALGGLLLKPARKRRPQSM